MKCPKCRKEMVSEGNKHSCTDCNVNTKIEYDKHGMSHVVTTTGSIRWQDIVGDQL